MDYNTTQVNSPRYEYPTGKGANLGIHAVRMVGGTRYKLWFFFDGKRKYILLPRTCDIKEAKVRRDRLFARLKRDYGAKPRKVVRTERKTERTVTTITDDTFIYPQPAWLVKVMGRKVATARTKAEALEKRDEWLAANADKLPRRVERRVRP